ncbi:hypothetical protein [Pseudomonas sp. ATCC PTA-122608]|uniref:hypothetical protein n=1 Tax=Pseudomonas sp. ATCC PTA-122608 TaxID=1771311 RepID=UPI00117BCD4F|nr:hypothetical protein [Pseudomonas sp. ATCC PTA-122608]
MTIDPPVAPRHLRGGMKGCSFFEIKSFCHLQCCILHKLFERAESPAIDKQILRGATTMHEIPNLPFPSLHETEQPTPQQAGATKPEPKEAKPVDRKR